MAATKKVKAASPDIMADSGDAGKQAASCTAAPEAPVAMVIHKRLRAAKKKMNRIQELEAKQAAGATLTEEQVRCARSLRVPCSMI
jgi:glyceraldehyde-3-phosphate dehydrogenase/erythrose-4-phosphate dehydrogenase